jgi:hypothetical protein
MSEFKYLDIVEVRDSETQEWKRPRFYLGSVQSPFVGTLHITMWPDQNQYTFTGHVDSWNFVRKHEPEPASEPALTIEERLQRIEAAIGLGPHPKD